MKNNRQLAHVWSVLCRSSSIDIDSNLISLFDVIENVEVVPTERINPRPDGAVSVSIESEIVTLWERKNSDDRDISEQVFLRLVDPQGKVLKESVFLLDIKRGFKRMRFRLKINGIVVTTAGEYRFKLYLKEESGEQKYEVASLPLDVGFSEPEK